MAGIFISYRREGAAGHAGRLFDRLAQHFGRDKVFMDVDIEPGVEFAEVIDQAVGSCDVLIVVIGKEWARAADAAGKRRLDAPNDFVRLEVTTALRRNVRVIPLLVDGAPLPPTESLPEDLQKLTRRNAFELRDGRWESDIGLLVEALEKVLRGPAKPDRPAVRVGEAADRRVVSVRFLQMAIGAAVIGAFVIAAAIWDGKGRNSRVDPIPTPATSTRSTEPAANDRAAVVPPMIGLAMERALARLERSGLQLGRRSPEVSRREPGTILSQSVPAGTRLAGGSTVDLVYAARATRQQAPAGDAYRQ